MLATDEDTCAALYLDLKKYSYTPHQDYPLLGWCRTLIEEALSHSVSHSQLDQNIFGLAGSISVDLPLTFHSPFLQRGFRKSQVKETEDSIRGYSLRWGSHWPEPGVPDRNPEKSSDQTRRYSDYQQYGSRHGTTLAKDSACSNPNAPSKKSRRKK